jgi:glycolate oxidase
MEFQTNEQIIQAARRNLSQGAWDYLAGGSESETTMRRNRLALDRLGFRPRVLVDVTDIDLSTTFLGHKLRIPVLLAPVGLLQNFHREAAAVPAAAAAKFGTMQAVATNTEPSLEEVAVAGGDAPRIFQLNIGGDLDWIKALIERVKAAGYVALCLTVDMAMNSRRDRALLTPGAPMGRRPAGGAARPNYRAGVTWETLDQIRALWGDRPFLLKGVVTAEDAALAVQHGVDVVWVSNHGGRQLDHGLGTMDELPEVLEAVGGRAEVVVDGGIQRGSDVVKALALGAKAVAIGKLQGWGMAAAGVDGVCRVLEILEEEMRITMGLIGVTSVGQLSPKYVARAEAVVPPHEMSSWVNMPKPSASWDGRIL